MRHPLLLPATPGTGGTGGTGRGSPTQGWPGQGRDAGGGAGETLAPQTLASPLPPRHALSRLLSQVCSLETRTGSSWPSGAGGWAGTVGRSVSLRQCDEAMARSRWPGAGGQADLKSPLLALSWAPGPGGCPLPTCHVGLINDQESLVGPEPLAWRWGTGLGGEALPCYHSGHWRGTPHAAPVPRPQGPPPGTPAAHRHAAAPRPGPGQLWGFLAAPVPLRRPGLLSPWGCPVT